MKNNYIIAEILNKISLAGDEDEMKQVVEELKEAKQVLDIHIIGLEENLKISADKVIINSLYKKEDLEIELNDLKLNLYNQWHDLNATFGIDNLVGIQEFIENNSRIKELRSIIREQIK